MSGRDVAEIPSALIGQPAPRDEAARRSTAPACRASIRPQFKGKVTVLNVWASWCAPCREEHPLLLGLAGDKRFALAGLNYKDRRRTWPEIPGAARQSVRGDRRRSGRAQRDRLGRLRRSRDLRDRQGRQDRLQACRAADGRSRRSASCCPRSRRRWPRLAREFGGCGTKPAKSASAFLMRAMLDGSARMPANSSGFLPSNAISSSCPA